MRGGSHGVLTLDWAAFPMLCACRLVTSQDCAKSLKNVITAHSDSVRARGWPPEAGPRARAHRAFDVNSASSYINDPFGHSSKEVFFPYKKWR